YETLATADGPLAVAVGTDRQFAGLVRILGVPEMATDPRFETNTQRVAHRDELKALLEEQLAKRPAAEWSAVLSKEGVPAGKVNSIVEALELAQELGLDPAVEMADDAGPRTSHQVANPIHLSETPASYRRLPPLLGEHNDATFAALSTTTTSH
ncbi:CoA transferase, partial [Arthrobacter sp. EH-1B-1]